MSNTQENLKEQINSLQAEQKLPDPNPETQKRHRHEMLWQVYAPLTVGMIVVLLLMILTISGTNHAIRKGADVSLIWLIAPVLVISLIILAVNSAAIYGIARLIKVIPGYSCIVLDYFILAGMYVNKLGDRIVAPVFRVRTFNASLRQLGRSIQPKRD